MNVFSRARIAEFLRLESKRLLPPVSVTELSDLVDLVARGIKIGKTGPEKGHIAMMVIDEYGKSHLFKERQALRKDFIQTRRLENERMHHGHPN